jgi:hypothetical protein
MNCMKKLSIKMVKKTNGFQFANQLKMNSYNLSRQGIIKPIIMTFQSNIMFIMTSCDPQSVLYSLDSPLYLV